MRNPDSFDRIVSYFHALASEDFTYKGETVKAYRELHISNLAFRGYTCPEGCGACCMRCSLVWDNQPPEHVPSTAREVQVNGVPLPWFQDSQADHTERFCRYLDQSSGRCGIYKERPLPCRFELFKFVHNVARGTARGLVRLPGRNWGLTRIDGQKGAKCEVTDYDRELTETHIRDLRILWRWMDEFQIANDCERVIDYLRTGPHPTTLKIIRNEASLW